MFSSGQSVMSCFGSLPTLINGRIFLGSWAPNLSVNAHIPKHSQLILFVPKKGQLINWTSVSQYGPSVCISGLPYLFLSFIPLGLLWPNSILSRVLLFSYPFFLIPVKIVKRKLTYAYVFFNGDEQKQTREERFSICQCHLHLIFRNIYHICLLYIY